jgi:hypothetical protein
LKKILEKSPAAGDIEAAIVALWKIKPDLPCPVRDSLQIPEP